MFFIENPKLQALMIAMVALSLALNVFLLAIYSSPFSGDLKILPEAFDLDTNTFLRGSPPLVFETPKDDDDDKDEKGKDKGKHAKLDKDSSEDSSANKDNPKHKGKKQSKAEDKDD